MQLAKANLAHSQRNSGHPVPTLDYRRKALSPLFLSFSALSSRLESISLHTTLHSSEEVFNQKGKRKVGGSANDPSHEIHVPSTCT